ncbi:MAG TPA: transposase family protein [Gemmatimonadaceae bacterium]|nr:transposase family protein [Gemmatimonadaceae bacterium]
MNTSRALVLAALTHRRLAWLLGNLPTASRRGRPWSCSRRRRVLIACAALRSNLTIRELAASFGISKSAVHRIVATVVPQLASLASADSLRDRRRSWVVDGTLIPTRDHARAARSKNDRGSCNAQVLVRRCDLRVVAAITRGPGNRNDPVHYRGSSIQALCQQHGRVLADGGYRGLSELVTPVFRGKRILRDRAWRQHRKRRARVEHVIARLKNWRVLRDHRRRGHHLGDTLKAVAYLHNLHVDELRDNS